MGDLYDISDDRLRERVAGRLGTFGWRVQDFECTFDSEALPDVTAALQRELGEATDAEIRIYRICRQCLGRGRGNRKDAAPSGRGSVRDWHDLPGRTASIVEDNDGFASESTV